jgi:hypothetical protein
MRRRSCVCALHDSIMPKSGRFRNHICSGPSRPAGGETGTQESRSSEPPSRVASGSMDRDRVFCSLLRLSSGLCPGKGHHGPRYLTRRPVAVRIPARLATVRKSRRMCDGTLTRLRDAVRRALPGASSPQQPGFWSRDLPSSSRSNRVNGKRSERQPCVMTAFADCDAYLQTTAAGLGWLLHRWLLTEKASLAAWAGASHISFASQPSVLRQNLRALSTYGHKLPGRQDQHLPRKEATRLGSPNPCPCLKREARQN